MSRRLTVTVGAGVDFAASGASDELTVVGDGAAVAASGAQDYVALGGASDWAQLGGTGDALVATGRGHYVLLARLQRLALARADQAKRRPCRAARATSRSGAPMNGRP